ncbi:MAG: redoxin domain-containing protein [Planctomycetes bacterium]|nr:redoxin domain-containing protein [Planctomycetota bacterium]
MRRRDCRYRAAAMVAPISLRVVAQVLASWVVLAAGLAQAPPPADGTTAPDFVSHTVDGQAVRLADFAGKIVVLDFWATWCGPCIGSMPHLQEVAAAHRDELVVLAVCTSDARGKFDEWVKANAGKYPDLRFTCDPNDRDSDTFEDRASQKHYRVAGLPTKFVIGRDGKIALGILGLETDDRRLEAGLARAGVAIDDATATAGEAQVKAVAERLAREAAERARRPTPAFFPAVMRLQHGDPLPACTLLDADGKEFGMDRFAGKPVIVAMTPASGAPRQLLQEIALRYQALGVTTLAVMPFTAVDEDGKGAVMGSFLRGDKMWDGIGNLLLRAGVSLLPKDMPREVATDEAFARKAERPAEAPVTLLPVGSKAPEFACQDLARARRCGSRTSPARSSWSTSGRRGAARAKPRCRTCSRWRRRMRRRAWWSWRRAPTMVVRTSSRSCG